MRNVGRVNINVWLLEVHVHDIMEVAFGPRPTYERDMIVMSTDVTINTVGVHDCALHQLETDFLLLIVFCMVHKHISRYFPFTGECIPSARKSCSSPRIGMRKPNLSPHSS